MSSSDFLIGGYGQVPDTGVRAAALQVDLYGGACTGSLTVYPKGTAKPALDDIAYNSNEFHTTMLSWLADGRQPPALGSRHPNLAPYQAFPTRDGVVPSDHPSWGGWEHWGPWDQHGRGPSPRHRGR